MKIRLSDDARSAIANALREACSNGYLEIRAGRMPSSPAVSDGQMLARIPLAGASVDAGALIFRDLPEVDAERSGVAAFARLTTSGGMGVIDVDAGSPNSDAALKLNTADIVRGGPVRVSRFEIFIPR